MDASETETAHGRVLFFLFPSSRGARKKTRGRDVFSPFPRSFQSLVSTRAEGTKLKPLRYYNSAVHGAAFVLPEFARAAVEPFVVPGTGFS